MQEVGQGAALFRANPFVPIASQGRETARGFRSRDRLDTRICRLVPAVQENQVRRMAFERDRQAEIARFDFNIQLAIGAALGNEPIQFGKQQTGRLTEADPERPSHDRMIRATAYNVRRII